MHADTMINGQIMNKNGSRKPEKECTEIECGDISKIDFNKIAARKNNRCCTRGIPMSGLFVGLDRDK